MLRHLRQGAFSGHEKPVVRAPSHALVPVQTTRHKAADTLRKTACPRYPMPKETCWSGRPFSGSTRKPRLLPKRRLFSAGFAEKRKPRPAETFQPFPGHLALPTPRRKPGHKIARQEGGGVNHLRSRRRHRAPSPLRVFCTEQRVPSAGKTARLKRTQAPFPSAPLPSRWPGKHTPAVRRQRQKPCRTSGYIS